MGPFESITQMASRSVQLFLHSSQQSVVTRQRCWAMAFPIKIVPSHRVSESSSNTWSLGQLDSASKMASGLGQPFMHSSRQTLPILYNRQPSPKIDPSHGGSGPSGNTLFFGLPESINQMASRSVQPFLQGSLLRLIKRQTNRQTNRSADRQTVGL